MPRCFACGHVLQWLLPCGRHFMFWTSSSRVRGFQADASQSGGPRVEVNSESEFLTGPSGLPDGRFSSEEHLTGDMQLHISKRKHAPSPLRPLTPSRSQSRRSALVRMLDRIRSSTISWSRTADQDRSCATSIWSMIVMLAANACWRPSKGMYCRAKVFCMLMP